MLALNCMIDYCYCLLATILKLYASSNQRNCKTERTEREGATTNRVKVQIVIRNDLNLFFFLSIRRSEAHCQYIERFFVVCVYVYSVFAQHPVSMITHGCLLNLTMCAGMNRHLLHVFLLLAHRPFSVDTVYKLFSMLLYQFSVKFVASKEHVLSA